MNYILVMVNGIIFICAYNKTRSQIAEFLFNKYNKNKKWHAISAGVFGGKYEEDLDLAVVAKKYDFIIKKPKTLDKDILGKQSKIIVVADDVPLSLFNGYKKHYGIGVSNWKIKDGWKRDGKTRVDRLEEVYLDIERKMEKFVKRLNRKS